MNNEKYVLSSNEVSIVVLLLKYILVIRYDTKLTMIVKNMDGRLNEFYAT